MEFDSKIAIGISLGTVNCCVGASVQGQVKIIPNDQGNLTTYSYVAFTNEEYLIGDAAKGQASLNPKNTLYDFMKLIGRKFSDPFVQTVSLDWPFKIEPDPEDDPLFIVEYKGEVKKYKPQEITQMMLARLKGNAEYYIGKTVTDAVVTVPDSFNEFQLKLIEKAATAAGLNVVKITNESFAAVRAYEFDKKDFSEKNDKMKTIFIFNIGGNSLNISIVGINDGICELVTYLSDSGIGGKRFDYKLAEYIIDNVLEEHKTDITQNRRAMTRLLNQCDRVKRILSVTGQVVCEIDSLINGIDLLKEISREKFEELCSSYFERCLELSEKSLKEAGKPKEAIDEVILIGGSSRIPKIRQLLAKFFERQASSNTLFTPESALAYGATVITDTLLAPKFLMPHFPDEIEYSDKYSDDTYEYRHVILPKPVYKKMAKGRLLTEIEWRSLGVQQSRGWVHYEIHKPEPYILLFRRLLGTDPNTGVVPTTSAETMEPVKPSFF